MSDTVSDLNAMVDESVEKIAVVIHKDGRVHSKVGREELRELVTAVLPKLDQYEAHESKANLNGSGNMHVDTFIDGISHKAGSDEAYAAFFFQMHRFPAYQQMKWAPFTKQFKLYCTYKGTRYRVTGCSRMGDIWLAKNLDQENSYDHRVYVNDVTEWSAVR